MDRFTHVRMYVVKLHTLSLDVGPLSALFLGSQLSKRQTGLKTSYSANQNMAKRSLVRKLLGSKVGVGGVWPTKSIEIRRYGWSSETRR